MFKKIALAAALVTSAAFATWDYYPVLEAGKGSAEAGMYYDWDHKWSQAGLTIGARYSIIQNLELSLQGWGYQFWKEEDCDGCENGGDGLRDLTIGGRYQFDPMVNAFVDVNLPIGGDEVTNDEISLYFGAQFSMPVTTVPGLKFGTEGAFDWGFEHDNKERGLDMHLSGEVGYTVPNVGVTPFAGLKLKYRLKRKLRRHSVGVVATRIVKHLSVLQDKMHRRRERDAARVGVVNDQGSFKRASFVVQRRIGQRCGDYGQLAAQSAAPQLLAVAEPVRAKLGKRRDKSALRAVESPDKGAEEPNPVLFVLWMGEKPHNLFVRCKLVDEW